MDKKTGRTPITPTGVSRVFKEDEIIVSKTNTRGIITYANDVFLRVSGYTQDEIIGKPHNWIRHPEMPRCVFQLLWQRLKDKAEIFAYVNNLAKNGDYYWVLAHVTPTLNAQGEVLGYHSSRRVPETAALKTIEGIYAALLAEEHKHTNPNAGMAAGTALLNNTLNEKGVSYDEFIFAL